MKKTLTLVIITLLACQISFGQEKLEKAPTASEVLKKALVQAKKENKNVFLMWHASWCGWCHRMDTLMARADVAHYFTDNFVITHLVNGEYGEKKILENAGADELIKKYHGDKVGIPFWIVLNADGKLLADAFMRKEGQSMKEPGTNSGCPANEDEVQHWLDVLKKTTDIDDAGLAKIYKVFRMHRLERYAPERLTVKDYKNAELANRQHVNKLVDLASVRPNWISQHEFVYSDTKEGQLKHFLVNAKKQKVKEITEEKRQELIPAGGRRGGRTISPDGMKAAYIEDYNLWINDFNTGEKIQLTFDGEEDFGYATNNAGWTKSDAPVLLWSPDSRKIATFRHDGRGVGEMYMVSTKVGHPKLYAWKYPLPEDSVIFRVHRIIIDLDQGKIIPLKMDPDQHRSSITDHIASGGKLADAEWSADSKQLMFLSNSRDHKEVTLRVADAQSGEVRTVLEEKVNTFFESGFSTPNWRFFPESDEFIWFSQRSNWGHLYLYDLKTGKLKNQITEGNWNVHTIYKIDPKTRTILFSGVGREPGDPYFQYFYRVNMNGEKLSLLTPDSANHRIQLSPKGDYFTDTWSTPQKPPIVDLRSTDGKKTMRLDESDISELLETGWKPPMSFNVKGRDGKTDVYGMLFSPQNMDPNKKYPIVNSIYPGPQSGSVGSRSFSAARGDKQAFANLGFIVVSIDGMGTPGRSKSFHDTYYGNMGDNTLPDQIIAMQQLADEYPWIDLGRVGIYGHSGGGFASTDAILRYPNFFHVAVSGAGNHDNRTYEDDWGEKWQGLLETYPDGSTNYDNQANQLLAKNLKGKLLLAHGTLDGNVPVNNTLLVVDALIAANKDFDLIIFPNRGHGFGGYYMTRRRWDYFVTHLLDAKHPVNYEMGK